MPGKGEAVLGITEHGLFIPILTFVFGEAVLGGQAAVVFTHRLRWERYGLPSYRKTLLERMEKEVLHELGYILGLVHCRDPFCLMHFSNSVEEVDLKAGT